jgi:hypothetical protein
MVAKVRAVAFHGVEVIEVETQVTIASGLPAFTVVGLPDKAVAESRERVRAALASLGLGLPPVGVYDLVMVDPPGGQAGPHIAPFRHPATAPMELLSRLTRRLSGIALGGSRLFRPDLPFTVQTALLEI